MTQPNGHLRDLRTPSATSPRQAVVKTLHLPEPAATPTETCPDLPAQLEQIAADVAALWMLSDSPPTLAQALTAGEACGRLRAHAIWLRAKQRADARRHPDLTAQQIERLYDQLRAHAQRAAIRSGTRAAGLSTLFGLIREEVHSNGHDQSTKEPGPAGQVGVALRSRSQDRSSPQELNLAGECPAEPRAEAPQPAGGTPHHEGTVREDTADQSPADEPAPKRQRRQVSPAGREAMRLSGRRLQERRRVARAAVDETTTCPLCEQTRLVDGEHLCEGDSSNGAGPGKRPARLQVIYDLGREGNTPPPWVANDPALLAVYDEGLREARPTTEAATPRHDDGERIPRRDEDKVSCPRCGRSIGTNRWGTISAHKTDGVRCDGAGTRPAEGTALTPAAAGDGAGGQAAFDERNTPGVAGGHPDEPTPNATGTRQRRDTTRRSAVQLPERRRIAAATHGELTTCVNCGDARLIDGDHTCRRGRVIESIARPVAVPEPRTDTCTHSSTTDGITTMCRKPAGHDEPCSWEYQPREERRRQPATSPVTGGGGLGAAQPAETALAAGE